MAQRKPPMTVTEMARLGGLARSAQLTPAQRSERARQAVKARWKKFHDGRQIDYQKARERAIEMRAQGKTQAAIARELGVSFQSVWKWFHPHSRATRKAS